MFHVLMPVDRTGIKIECLNIEMRIVGTDIRKCETKQRNATHLPVGRRHRTQERHRVVIFPLKRMV